MNGVWPGGIFIQTGWVRQGGHAGTLQSCCPQSGWDTEGRGPLRPAIGRLDRGGKVVAVGWIPLRSAGGGAAARRPVPRGRFLSTGQRSDRASAFLHCTSFATSQQEMMLTPKTRSTPTSSSSGCLGCSRSGRETHQTQMWVSSRITARRPSPRWQQAPTAHGTREPSLEGFGPQPTSTPRFSRPPTLQPAGRAQMERSPKRVRRTYRL